MTAGLHMKVDVIQINNNPDDDIGGAVITGTTVFSSLPAVLTPRRPSQAKSVSMVSAGKTYTVACTAMGRRKLGAPSVMIAGLNINGNHSNENTCSNLRQCHRESSIPA